MDNEAVKASASNAIPNNPLSRRNFLTLAGLGSGIALSTLLSGCTLMQQETSITKPSITIPTPDVGMSDRIPDAAGRLELKIDAIIEQMSIEQKVAQLFIIRPEDLAGFGALTQVDDQFLEVLKQWPVGGFIYFAKNLIDAAQTQTMLNSTFAYSIEANGIPPFMCVDEEGGTVSRIGGVWGFDAPNMGDMRNVGATGDVAYAKDVATTIASYLKPLGFNTDFAPVCDVASDPYSSMMSERSFGSDAGLVAQMAGSQIEGFLEQGMLCSAKHFPGIGSATGDSHFVTISSSATLEDLYAFELIPFISAIEAGVPFVMVGHFTLPNVTGDYTPASLSPVIIQKLLREELAYEGLIITDALDMGAVSSYYGPSEAVLRTFEAGTDIALIPGDFWQSISYVLDAVNNGTLSEDRINASVRRILRAKLTYFADSFAVLPQG